MRWGGGAGWEEPWCAESRVGPVAVAMHPTALTALSAWMLASCLPYCTYHLSRHKRVRGMNTFGEKVMWRWAVSRSAAAAAISSASDTASAAAKISSAVASWLLRASRGLLGAAEEAEAATRRAAKATKGLLPPRHCRWRGRGAAWCWPIAAGLHTGFDACAIVSRPAALKAAAMLGPRTGLVLLGVWQPMGRLDPPL